MLVICLDVCRGKGYPSILDASIDSPLSITQTQPIANPSAQATRGLPTMESGANGTAGGVPAETGTLQTVV